MIERHPSGPDTGLPPRPPSSDGEAADRSILYGIDSRGFALIDAAGITDAVEAIGVPSNQPILRVLPDGTADDVMFAQQQASDDLR